MCSRAWKQPKKEQWLAAKPFLEVIKIQLNEQWSLNRIFTIKLYSDFSLPVVVITNDYLKRWGTSFESDEWYQ